MIQQPRKIIMSVKKHPDKAPNPYTGIYSMHKYWSKKPFNVINRYIDTYSKPNDIVLDPFVGSGICSTESIFLNRRTVGIDINPMSIFIAKQMLKNINPKNIQNEFLKLQDKTRKKIDNLYKITIDNKSYTGSHFIHINDTVTEIWYKKDGLKKTVNTSNIHNIKTPKDITYNDIETYIPTKKLIRNSRINAKENMSVHDLFTPRNTLALSILLDTINNIQNRVLRDFFRFCFTSCSGQASKMVFVISNRKNMQMTSSKKQVGSWVIGYWIPKEHFEINVWNCFENRYQRILKSKTEYVKSSPNVRYAKNFKSLENNEGNILLVNDSCHKILKKLPDSSIDYIITDPPHGNRLPYMELSMMWNDWLGFDTDMKNELVVSNARSRDKTVTGYITQLEKILIEINRVLKNDRYFTLMFNSYEKRVWKSLQEILFGLDFELSDVSTIGYSAASVIQDSRKGGLKTDFIFTFKKKASIKNKRHGTADKDTINALITDYLGKNKDSSTYKILNHVIIHLIRNRLVFDMSLITSAIASRFQ